jgi:hypothetical protein
MEDIEQYSFEKGDLFVDGDAFIWLLPALCYFIFTLSTLYQPG